MPLVYSWFFWVFIIGVIALLIGGILIFATDLGWIAWLVAGAGLLFIIIGVIFWIMDARKPKKKLSGWEKFKQRTPGVYEFTQFENKSGLGNARRRVQQYGVDATKAAGRGIVQAGRGVQGFATSEPIKRQAKLGAATLPFMLNPYTALPAFQVGSVAAIYNFTKSRGRQNALNQLKTFNPQLAEQIRQNSNFNTKQIKNITNQYVSQQMFPYQQQQQPQQSQQQ